MHTAAVSAGGVRRRVTVCYSPSLQPGPGPGASTSRSPTASRSPRPLSVLRNEPRQRTPSVAHPLRPPWLLAASRPPLRLPRRSPSTTLELWKGIASSSLPHAFRCPTVHWHGCPSGASDCGPFPPACRRAAAILRFHAAPGTPNLLYILIPITTPGARSPGGCTDRSFVRAATIRCRLIAERLLVLSDTVFTLTFDRPPNRLPAVTHRLETGARARAVRQRE